jgi:putative transposase
MARRPRIVLPGWMHHVTQRGNHRQQIFFSIHDRIVYLRLVAEYFPKYGLRLVGYCLMDNHVHLAVIPEVESSMADGLGILHHDFARWQNIQCKRNGHLWQNRYFSCPVEDDRVWDALSYVELNPVRARMVEHAWDFEWSSAKAHIEGTDASGLLDMAFWRETACQIEWKEYLEKLIMADSFRDWIRSTTARGLFLGRDSTARQLEEELGKRLILLKRGRKC